MFIDVSFRNLYSPSDPAYFLISQNYFHLAVSVGRFNRENNVGSNALPLKYKFRKDNK